MGTIILTSDSFANTRIKEKFLALSKKRDMAAIVTTAAKGKENHKYSQLAHDQFLEFGFKTVDFVDFESNPQTDISMFDVIYVCGGNTFRLMNAAKQSNFRDQIKKVLDGGGIYVGVSAGSLIVGPSIQIANEIKPDVNEVELTDLSGLDIIPQIIFPHYDISDEPALEKFEKAHGTKVTRLKNGEAIFITGEKIELVN